MMNMNVVSESSDNQTVDYQLQMREKQQVHDNQNIQATYAHILGDLAQSSGVLLISLIIYFKSTWIFLDPVISFIFIIISLSFSFGPTKEILNTLLDSVPEDFNLDNLKKRLILVKGVEQIHDLHVWEYY